jgi:hypothetical protein
VLGSNNDESLVCNAGRFQSINNLSERLVNKVDCSEKSRGKVQSPSNIAGILLGNGN